ncbi:MAG TPA: isoprenyl transferase [Candidatus Goldiibacteriota bacterium]|nr:isoprenyl transferase [Candidatus Goldiibacteriota bacterium]
MKDKKLPVHVAVIMDGNGRWAKKRNLPRIFGHREGAKSVRAVTEAAAEAGIKYLTLYAFSTENWKRPEKEVDFLMGLLENHLKTELPVMMKNNVRLHTIGNILALPERVQKKLKIVKRKTSSNTGLNLVLALNYGARDEITAAVRKIAFNAKKGLINPCKIGHEDISRQLYTADIPDPDLLIRTSGEMRISNFLLWQIAYSELYVTKVLWPDFRKKEFLKALREFSRRERRFGGI